MKLQKIILCVAVALTAFGASLGLLEIGRYLTADSPPKPAQVNAVQPIPQKENAGLSDDLPPEVTVFPLRAAPPPPVAEADAKNEEETEPETYIGGDYYIIGKLPKGFKDFDSLSIQTTDYALASPGNNYEDVYIPPKGYIFTKKEFNFIRISVSNKRLSFETEKIKGISYKFVGKYVDETIDMGEYLEHAELEGVLIKMRDGKKIAEINVKFAAGGC